MHSYDKVTQTTSLARHNQHYHLESPAFIRLSRAWSRVGARVGSREQFTLQLYVAGFERFKMRSAEEDENGGNTKCRNDYVDHGPEISRNLTNGIRKST